MNLAEYKARRAALVQPRYRELCPQCRKARPTCYCERLRPFAAPVPFVILQHYDEWRNAIATARMAHLSMTNSRLFVGLHFDGHREVDHLLDDPTHRNIMLYPSRDAVPLESLLTPPAAGADGPPLRLWILDAKWSQVPKMLRLSPRVRDLPRASFVPDQGSAFRIRRQPRPDCVSTIEAIFHVIDRVFARTGGTSTAHHTLIDVFQHFVRQQLAFVDPAVDTRHQIAKALRAARRQAAGKPDLPRRGTPHG
jgi:DTW domain-containing protein YfiP